MRLLPKFITIDGIQYVLAGSKDMVEEMKRRMIEFKRLKKEHEDRIEALEDKLRAEKDPKKRAKLTQELLGLKHNKQNDSSAQDLQDAFDARVKELQSEIDKATRAREKLKEKLKAFSNSNPKVVQYDNARRMDMYSTVPNDIPDLLGKLKELESIQDQISSKKKEIDRLVDAIPLSPSEMKTVTKPSIIAPDKPPVAESDEDEVEVTDIPWNKTWKFLAPEWKLKIFNGTSQDVPPSAIYVLKGKKAKVVVEYRAGKWARKGKFVKLPFRVISYLGQHLLHDDSFKTNENAYAKVKELMMGLSSKTEDYSKVKPVQFSVKVGPRHFTFDKTRSKKVIHSLNLGKRYYIKIKDEKYVIERRKSKPKPKPIDGFPEKYVKPVYLPKIDGWMWLSIKEG